MAADDRPRSASEYWARRREREARYGKRSLNVRREYRITDAYCFCGQSSLYETVCSACGKPPYTD